MDTTPPRADARREPTSSTPPANPPSAARHAWLRPGLAALVILPLIELVGIAVVRSRVVEPSAFEPAASHVRSVLRPGDIVLAAPAWADPLVRRVLGDQMSLASAGPSDLAPFERAIVVSIRGARRDDLIDARLRDERTFGDVEVHTYDLGASAVLYDLVAHVAEADVTLETPSSSRTCQRVAGRPSGGGLGAGPLVPGDHFTCDPARPWLWVGRTVVEDLDLAPRTCIHQHAPGGPDALVSTFRDVPLGDRLILYAGLYYEHERMREHGPVDVLVTIDGHEVGRMTHRDGDGWKRMEVSPPAPGESSPERRGTVAIRVSAQDPQLRALCFSATTRGGR